MNKILTLTACLMATVLSNAQTTIHVKSDGTGNGTSWTTACNLGTAVKNAMSGTQIWVQKGTYYPSKMLVVSDSVKIYGGFSGTETILSQRDFLENPTIIDGQQKVGSIFRLENSAEINGLTIQNGNANGNPQKNGGGVWADENAVIENCKIINNTATANGGGVYAKGEVKIINGGIENNTAMGEGADLYGTCIIQVSIPVTTGCNEGTFDFGTVSFQTNNEYTITGTVDGQSLTQIWSDAVTTANCQKTTYAGGSSGNYNTDCRTNPNYPGDLFSWCAVARFADVLCPDLWHVPTTDDFINLDKILGGTGVNRTVSRSDAIFLKYTGSWGGTIGGLCYANGSVDSQRANAYYWSQTNGSLDNGNNLRLASSVVYIYPQNSSTKYYGFALRCVR